MKDTFRHLIDRLKAKYITDDRDDNEISQQVSRICQVITRKEKSQDIKKASNTAEFKVKFYTAIVTTYPPAAELSTWPDTACEWFLLKDYINVLVAEGNDSMSEVKLHNRTSSKLCELVRQVAKLRKLKEDVQSWERTRAEARAEEPGPRSAQTNMIQSFVGAPCSIATDEGDEPQQNIALIPRLPSCRLFTELNDEIKPFERKPVLDASVGLISEGPRADVDQVSLETKISTISTEGRTLLAIEYSAHMDESRLQSQAVSAHEPPLNQSVLPERCIKPGISEERSVEKITTSHITVQPQLPARPSCEINPISLQHVEQQDVVHCEVKNRRPNFPENGNFMLRSANSTISVSENKMSESSQQVHASEPQEDLQSAVSSSKIASIRNTSKSGRIVIKHTKSKATLRGRLAKKESDTASTEREKRHIHRLEKELKRHALQMAEMTHRIAEMENRMTSSQAALVPHVESEVAPVPQSDVHSAESIAPLVTAKEQRKSDERNLAFLLSDKETSSSSSGDELFHRLGELEGMTEEQIYDIPLDKTIAQAILSQLERTGPRKVGHSPRIS